MTAAIKSILVPELRAQGFRGSLPHFYRAGPARTDFLTVQFHSAGGSFVVEIAKCGPNGIESGHGEGLPVSKLNVQYFADRLRLGSNPAAGTLDHWFEFGPRNYDPPQVLQPASHHEGIASQVCSYSIRKPMSGGIPADNPSSRSHFADRLVQA